MAVKIITDSTCDIPIAEAASMGVEILSLTVGFQGRELRDGVDITPDQFYKSLGETEEMPSTSQVTVDAFTQAFQRVLETPEDEVVCLTISPELSGTYQSATIARDALDSSRIHLADTRTVAFGLAALVREAVRMRDEGMGGADMAVRLHEDAARQRFFVALDTLKYLRKGGRLSGASAAMGTLLGIKPILTVVDGKLEVAHKARGNRAAIQWMVDQAAAGKADTSRPFCTGHSAAPEALEQFCGQLKALAGAGTIYRYQMGITVGTHAGPGSVGVAYFEK